MGDFFGERTALCVASVYVYVNLSVLLNMYVLYSLQNSLVVQDKSSLVECQLTTKEDKATFGFFSLKGASSRNSSLSTLLLFMFFFYD